MKTILTIILLWLGTAAFGQAPHIQYDSLTERYFAEIEPMAVKAGADSFSLTRVYLRTINDSTINIFISYALLHGEGYTSFVKSYGLDCGGDLMAVFVCIADKIEIPGDGIGSALQRITYR